MPYCSSVELFQFNEKGEISRSPEILVKYLSHRMSAPVAAQGCTNPGQSPTATLLLAGPWVFPCKSHYCCAWESHFRLSAKRQVKINLNHSLLHLQSVARDVGANNALHGLEHTLQVLIPSINCNQRLIKTNLSVKGKCLKLLHPTPVIEMHPIVYSDWCGWNTPCSRKLGRYIQTHLLDFFHRNLRFYACRACLCGPLPFSRGGIAWIAACVSANMAIIVLFLACFLVVGVDRYPG